MFWKGLIKRGVLLSALVLVAFGVCISAADAKQMTFDGKTYDIAKPGEFIANEIVVQMKDGASLRQAQAVASKLMGQIVGTIPEYNLFLIRMASKGTLAADAVPQALNAAKGNPDVKGAFPNHKFSIPKPVVAAKADKTAVSDEEMQSNGAAQVQGAPAIVAAAAGTNQWHLDVINASNAGTPPTSTPLVAVVDTGVEYNNSLDLAGQVVKGKDYIDDDMDPEDMNGHGTHVSGIIAGKGVSAVKGVSPTSKILAVRVLDADGSGSWFQCMQGITYARNYAGVKVINMSFGGYMQESTSTSSDYMVFKKVIDDTLAKGILPVVAAGNEDNELLYYYKTHPDEGNYRPVPAWFPNSFSVGATQEVDMRAYFSNYDIGTFNNVAYNYSFVDIVAPGYNILSTYLGGQVVRMGGTSMATPVVAGCAARYLGANPTKTAAQTAAQLVSTGKAVDVYFGFPSAEKRVDLMKAMGKSATGFVGVVYNGQTGRPLQGATVQAKVGSTVMKTVTTNYEGFFTVTGLTGGTTYTLACSKTGFSPYTSSMAAVANKLTNPTKAVSLNMIRASGQWSLLIDWRSWQPGYYEASDSYFYSWWPINWNKTNGTSFSPFVKSSSLGTLNLSNYGSLVESPFMAVLHDVWTDTHPAYCIVVKPQSGQTYKVYTLLDNDNSSYWEWGSYKDVASVTKPAVQARIFLAGTAKATVNASAATGTGTYWHIGTISGTTFTVVNKLQATAP